jgi:hypothetical protein
LPPVSLPKKVQLPRLWIIIHSRNYVQPRIMCTPISPGALWRVYGRGLVLGRRFLKCA